MIKTLRLITFFLILSATGFSQSQITWTMGMNVAASGFGNMHPRIVTDAAGNPLIVWYNAMDLMYSRWTGSSFTSPVTLNPASMNLAGASWMGPDIAAKGDTVYVVFKLMPEADTSSHIYLIRSFDGGLTFSNPSQVDNIGDSISRFPTVAIDDDGNPIVAFMKFDNTFMDSRWVVTRSNDFGNTFAVDIKASGFNGSSAVCDCCPGALANGGNTVLMLYRDNNNNIRDMWAGYSTDNANSFSSGMPVDQNNWQVFTCSASGPDGVIVGDSAYTVYMSGANGNTRVYFSVSSVSNTVGATGNEITGTIPGLNLQNYPRIATDGTAMGIAWKQSVSGTDQAALLFTNDMSIGFPAAYDTVDLGNVTNVDLAMKNGNIYVVWEDDGSGTVKYRSGTYSTLTGFSTQSGPSFSISPNITNDLIHINTLQAGAKLIVTDAAGRIVMNKILHAGPEDISLGELQEGIYFVTVKSQSSEINTSKIIKY